MKLTTVKKFNIVISLWLVVILATLAVFGYELGNYGFYIATAVVGAIIVLSNLAVMISGIIIPVKQQKRTSREYY